MIIPEFLDQCPILASAINYFFLIVDKNLSNLAIKQFEYNGNEKLIDKLKELMRTKNQCPLGVST